MRISEMRHPLPVGARPWVAIAALVGALLAAAFTIPGCARGGGSRADAPVATAAPDAPAGVTDAVSSGEMPSVPTIRIAGDALADLDDGDFLLPRFSPDGRTLAFASSMVRDGVEGGEVFLLDLTTGKRRRLLDANEAAAVGVYKAFIGDLEWSGRSVLRVDVADGDVGLTSLTYDTNRGAVVDRVHVEGDDEPQLPSRLEPAAQRVAALLPQLNPSEVRAAIAAFGAAVQDEGAILDPSGTGSDIRLVDFRRGVAVPLQGRPSAAGQELSGGFIHDDGAVYLIAGRDDARVYAHQGGTSREVARFAGAKCSYLRGIGSPPGAPAFFVVRTQAGNVHSDNPFFMYERGRISRIEDYAALADADVDPGASVVAFARWVGDVRHIAVRRLRTPRP